MSCPVSAVSGTEEGRQATAEQWLRDLARHASGPVHTLIVWGDPAAEICRVAQERHIDLIAMSTHGRTGRVLDLLGSVADTVVRLRALCGAHLSGVSLQCGEWVRLGDGVPVRLL